MTNLLYLVQVMSETPTTNVRTVTVTVSWSADTYAVASQTIVAQ